LLEPIENAFVGGKRPTNPAVTRAQIAAARDKLQTGSGVSARLDELEKKLAKP